MIRVRLTFVPPGGGEVDYGLTMDMPALPREGDYISVMREPPEGAEVKDDYLGTEDFIVRRVWWFCKFPDDGKSSHTAGQEPVGTAEINVECGFAVGPNASPAHKRGAENYEIRGKGKAQQFEATNY